MNKGKRTAEVLEMSMGAKWTITILLAVIAVVTVILCAKSGNFTFKPGSVQANDEAVTESATPKDEDKANENVTHKVFVSAGYGGTVDPKGNKEVPDWGSVTINITPNEGYIVKSVSVDGEDKGSLTSYTLSYITDDHTIVVTFEAEPEPTPTPSDTDDVYEQLFGDD